MQPLPCWDCGFESQRGQGCLSLVNVVCCQMEVSVSDRSFIQRSFIECGVSECDHDSSIMRKPWPNRAVAPWLKNKYEMTLGHFNISFHF